MAINPIQLKQKQSGEGGLWGKIAGGALGLAGAVAAPFTGGTSLAAVPAGLALAGAAAPIVGDAIDPVKVTGGSGPNPLATAAKVDPEAIMAGLSDANNALMENQSIPAPEKQRISETMFQPAMNYMRPIGGRR